MSYFREHTLLVGPNNVGKSTVLEALDLVLGPDRLIGPATIDEHDFHLGKYLASDPEVPEGDPETPAVSEAADSEADAEASPTEAPKISLTVTLAHLTEAELTRFRGHVEVWNAAESHVCTPDEAAALTPQAEDYVLRVAFRGWYDEDEDEFRADTVFLSPEDDEGEFQAFGKRDKQSIGFLYLRSLRTARRAATLQRRAPPAPRGSACRGQPAPSRTSGAAGAGIARARGGT